MCDLTYISYYNMGWLFFGYFQIGETYDRHDAEDPLNNWIAWTHIADGNLFTDDQRAMLRLFWRSWAVLSRLSVYVSVPKTIGNLGVFGPICCCGFLTTVWYFFEDLNSSQICAAPFPRTYVGGWLADLSGALRISCLPWGSAITLHVLIIRKS